MGFPLGWPSMLRDLFDVMSALNFNVDLLSPGCTVDVNFYTEYTLKTVQSRFMSTSVHRCLWHRRCHGKP